jgi:methylenetetrahydrofolate reductase (NADPH)
VANPFADPTELQLIRLGKKLSAGAKFLITQPVFDLDRFQSWWNEVTGRGFHEKAAIVAGVQPLRDAESAIAIARSRPSPLVPDAILDRITSAGDVRTQRATAIDVAAETIGRLLELDGLRGIQVRGDGDVDLTLAVLEKSGMGVE